MHSRAPSGYIVSPGTAHTLPRAGWRPRAAPTLAGCLLPRYATSTVFQAMESFVHRVDEPHVSSSVLSLLLLPRAFRPPAAALALLPPGRAAPLLPTHFFRLAHRASTAWIARAGSFTLHSPFHETPLEGAYEAGELLPKNALHPCRTIILLPSHLPSSRGSAGPVRV